jgi:putative aminopeptidase FrvX
VPIFYTFNPFVMQFNDLRIVQNANNYFAPQLFNNKTLKPFTNKPRRHINLSINENLETLSNACGVTGRENDVRDILIQLLKPYSDEVLVDKLENVIAVKKGKPKSPKIMLAAHMDEVGLMVKTINKDGFIKFTKMGGIDDRILLAQKVSIYTKKGTCLGVIGSKPPHIQKEEERKKIITYDDLFIDVGAESKEDASKIGIAIGDPITFDVKYTNLGNNVAIGKAFDDRVGCVTMVETLKLLKKTDCTVFAVGTIQEEVGLRGAVPDVREFDASAKMGKGPALTISDSGLITHPKVLRWLIGSAEETKIPFQLESGLLGSTDAARISITRQGIPCGTVSIPTRYIHSPLGMVHLKDIEASAKLTAAAIRRIPKHF